MFKKWICMILTLALVAMLTACSGGAAEPTTEATTEATTQATTEATTEVTTQSTEPPVVYHSGLREDGSFDSGTWFIGDSMTSILVRDYLKPNGLYGDASCTGKFGARIKAFFDGTTMDPNSYNRCVYNPEHEGMTYDGVARELGESCTAIYMMWGTNFTHDAGPEAYIEVVDFLLVTCPNATVHMQLIPWGSENVVEYETVNQWVREAYDYYQSIGEGRVFLIDTFTAIGKNHDSGFIHLNQQGNENWYNAIVDHAAANGLVQ